jgi:bacterial/archaeal transporter family-2 protein
VHAIWFLVPAVFGALQPVIIQMNLSVARHAGVVEAAVLLHAVGAAFGLGIWGLGLRGIGFGALGAVPWWAFLGGCIGVSGMAALNRAIPETGVAAAVALMVAFQLAFSLGLEHYGWMGADVRLATPGRVVGVVLLAAGAWLVSR